MAITDIHQVDLAVLFGNSDFRIYEISRDIELENIVINKAKTFWMDYVQQDCPPPTQSEPDCQTLYKQGNPTKSVEATHETNQLIQRMQLLNEEIYTRESEVSSIKQIIMNEMADSEILTYEGRLIATWKSPKQSYRINTKKLESELPKIYEQYKVPIQNSRRLTIK
jgi:predicted phage-related endonuclease